MKGSYKRAYLVPGQRPYPGEEWGLEFSAGLSLTHWSSGLSLGWGAIAPRPQDAQSTKQLCFKAWGTRRGLEGSPVLGQRAAGICAESLEVTQLPARPGRASSAATGSLQSWGPGVRIRNHHREVSEGPTLVRRQGSLPLATLPEMTGLPGWGRGCNSAGLFSLPSWRVLRTKQG